MLLYILQLECRDALSKFSVNTGVKLTPKQKSDTAIYAKSFILSPSLTSYREGASGICMDAMRELKVTSVPASSKNTICEEYKRGISKAMTLQRHAIKLKIEKTLGTVKEKTPTKMNGKDIATLTKACLGSTKVKASAALYYHIAFIRWVVTEFPSIEDNKFWPQVDTCMAELCKAFPAQKDLLEAYKDLYHHDIKSYREPNIQEYPTTPAAKLESWQTTLDTHASKRVVALASSAVDENGEASGTGGEEGEKEC